MAAIGTLMMNREITLALNQTTIFLSDWIKFKAFEDDKLNVAKIMLSVFDRVENIVGNEENAGDQHFFLFSQCFQKASFLVSLKLGTELNGNISVAKGFNF